MVQGKLTLKLVRAITEPGFYGDGNTLFLRVAPGGSKQWVQRLTVHGRRRSIGLGGVSYVTLAEAREAALENRRVARRGGDPLAEKRRANAPRFREAAQSTWESLRPRWRNAKVAANWLQQLERHAMKRLGDLPVNQIDREDVLAVLTPIWGRKQETARRVRRYIRATLDWCLAHGFVETNVAGDSINGALPRMAAVKAHYKGNYIPKSHFPLTFRRRSLLFTHIFARRWTWQQADRERHSERACRSCKWPTCSAPRKRRGSGWRAFAGRMARAARIADRPTCSATSSTNP